MPRYAAVDIGSNSVRMEIGDAEPAEAGGPVPALQIVDSDRMVTRLGEGVFSDSNLRNESIAKTCLALKRMSEAIEKAKVDGVRAVATSAVRDARNQEEFLAAATQALGHPIEIISGAEEARLIHLGVQTRWPHPDKSVLMIDIGGGSAEIILSRSGTQVDAFSKPLGAVRLQQLFLQDDPPTKARLAQMDAYIAGKLEGAVAKIGTRPVDQVIATSASASATMCAVHRIPREERERADRMRATSSHLKKLFERVSTIPLGERQKVTGIGPKRAEIIVPGIAVLRRVLADFQQPALWFSAAGVRDGIIADLYGRGTMPESSRLTREERREVEQMARRYGVDLKHARRVANLSRQIFLSLRKLHQLPHCCARMLEAAALLLDVGHYVSQSKHHRHSYYLVYHSDLPGFAAEERAVIANLCRYHRKSLPTTNHTGFEELSEEQRLWVRRLTPLLRLADGLDRSRKQLIGKINCALRNGRVELALESDGSWELERWAAERTQDAFQQIYTRDLVVVDS